MLFLVTNVTWLKYDILVIWLGKIPCLKMKKTEEEKHFTGHIVNSMLRTATKICSVCAKFQK